jgi:hypothetical protein
MLIVAGITVLVVLGAVWMEYRAVKWEEEERKRRL